MPIEVFPDSPRSVGMSPRISFSHDLPQNDTVPVQQNIRPSSSSDFDFCVFRDHQSSSADELFSDGKILPIEIKRRLAPPPRTQLEQPLPPPETEEVRTQKTAEEKSNYKTSSFWGFKRSSSLNCGSGYGRSLCPLPLLLSRSNSTGSTASGGSKRSTLSNNPKQNLLKHSNKQSQSSSSNHQKPPLKKSYNNYNGGVKITPVLNVPTANLFGLGSIFSGAKDKTRKK